MAEHEERLERAYDVLEGLSVGDALGEALSYRHESVRDRKDFSAFSDGSVRFTDDTEMALSVYDSLRLIREINEDALARMFAVRYHHDPDRGYGRMARRILQEIWMEEPWETVSRNAFGGGSFGNGAAMRVAPIGAYFSDHIDQIPEQAARSARVTHFHPEGIAGAVAVALASGVATAFRGVPVNVVCGRIWMGVLGMTSESRVREKLERAREMAGASTMEAARELGNGAEISAQDTVPFCVWNACRCLDNYEEAIVTSIEVGGDCDTNAAIVGGIVAGYLGPEAIPEGWRRVREPLPVPA